MRGGWRTPVYYVLAGVNVLSVLLPVWPWRYALLRHGLHIPFHILLLAQDATLLLGVSLLLLAYPAARGHRRAAQLMMLCAVLAVFTNLLKGLDVEEALLNLTLFVVLWRSRHRLVTVPVRYTLLDALRIGLVLLLAARVYSWLGGTVLMGLRMVVAQQETHSPVLRYLEYVLTARLHVQTIWFHQSQIVLPIFFVGLFVLISWSAVMRLDSSAPRYDPYERFGRGSHNSLAYLARRRDVLTFVDPAGQGAVSYRRVGRVALQIGAILGPSETREQVYRAFLAYCHVQHLIPAAVALAHDEHDIARGASMHTLALGTEAVVDLTQWSVESLNKKMRWVRRSLSKRGFAVELCPANALPGTAQAAVRRIDADWRRTRGGQDHGCCMTLGRIPTAADRDCLFALMRDEHDDLVGYMTLLPGGEGCYSLDLTRRLATAPNAAMEFLITEALVQLQTRGTTTVTLNFSTLSSLKDNPIGQRVLNIAGAAFQLQSLETFNNKFRPAWVPRYLAFPSWYVLPDVVYAILVVEGVDRMVINTLVRAMRHRIFARHGIPVTEQQTIMAGGA